MDTHRTHGLTAPRRLRMRHLAHRLTHRLAQGLAHPFARTSGLSTVLIIAAAPTAFAATAGSAMPWDTPLERLMQNLTGPTARVLVTCAVVGCGLLWAFTRNEDGLRRLGQVAFGGAIALGAAALMANLGFAGAVV